MEVGDEVLIRNMQSGKYDIRGRIVDDRKHLVTGNGGNIEAKDVRSRSFIVEGDQGGVYLRNAKFLKLNKIDGAVADA